MATNSSRTHDGYRALEILFNPWEGRRTSVNVLTVDYRGDRRVARRIGSVSLRVGRGDLVGLTPGEVTAVLVTALADWLSAERATLRPPDAGAKPGRAAAPAPPEGVTGAAWNPLVNEALPGL